MFANVEMKGERVKMKLDTASDLSMVSEQTKQLGEPKLRPMDCKAVTITGDELEMRGMFTTRILWLEVYTARQRCAGSKKRLLLLEENTSRSWSLLHPDGTGGARNTDSQPTCGGL